MSTLGNLYLLPVPISDEDGGNYIPAYNIQLVQTLTTFIAEDAKTARRFLKLFKYPDLSSAEILVLNEHTKTGYFNELIEPLLKGTHVGLMSDAGCPGIADPGAEVVKLAHKNGVNVVPLTGPSSIVLSIMASGFNGQNFAFVGYLPIEKPQKIKRIKELEQLAYKQNQAQFFIETPYRNEQLFEVLLSTLLPQSYLYVGINMCSPQQQLHSKTVAEWKKVKPPFLNKIPAVFAIYQ